MQYAHNERFGMVFVTIVMLAWSQNQAGAQDFWFDFKENNIDATGHERGATITLREGSGDGYFLFTVCPDSHKTAHNQMTFKHWHMGSFCFPVDATDDAGVPIQLTAAMVTAYYDVMHGFPSPPGSTTSVTKEGFVDTSQNCHSYAFGRSGMWIEDALEGAGIIYLDDYSAVNYMAEPIVGDLGARPDVFAATHSWKVTDAQVVGSGGPMRIVQTKEKFRSSEIYVTTYVNNTFVNVTMSTLMRKKP